MLRPNHLANLERVLERLHYDILTFEDDVLSCVRAELLLLLNEGVVAEYLPLCTSRTILTKNTVRVH